MQNKIFSKEAFSGKNLVISGGAGDIGLEVAMEFVKAGINKIALLDNNTDQLNFASDALKKMSCDNIKIETDLSKEASIKAAIEKIYKEEKHWDILVTSAGLYIGGTLIDYQADDWDKLMVINARSVFLLSRLMAEQMIKRGQGKIVHIGSSSTHYGTPGSGAYAASKAIVNQLTQTMAVEWGPHNIQVNTICPTVTETKFLKFVEGDALHEKFREKLKRKIALNRLLMPSDIAPTVLFLASEAAQFINGAVIPIDGGAKLVST